MRMASRQAKMNSYQWHRVADQQRWYANKSSSNNIHARNWLIAFYTANALGLVGAALKASAVTNVDLLGILAAAAAAIGAWLEVKQHRSLAIAYNVTARELRRVLTLFDVAMSPDQWADFVDQAEEAISREHTMWVASRTGRRLGAG
jgi:SMODS and SLOG-associating 2TM effector domain 1